MKRARWLLLAAAVLPPLAACTPNIRPADDPLREAVVQNAIAQLGIPYRYAGSDPVSGFDCSGLVWYAYAQAGVVLPRSSSEQQSAGVSISFEQALPGDLLFYRFIEKEQAALHVVLYLGDGAVIHAPVSSREVSIAKVRSPAWQRSFVGAVSVLTK